jgi:hypothetical protein
MLLFVAVTCFTACDSEDEPATLPPSLSFADADGRASAERGTDVEIELDIIAQGGIKSLTANGAAVTVPANLTQTSVTYTYSVNPDASIGDETIEFVLTDNKNRVNTITYTVTVIGSIIQVTNDITANTTWDEGNQYILTKTIKIENATLTISRGVTVLAVDDGKAVKASDKVLVALRIEATGKLIANGEVNKPVVFSVKTQDNSTPKE